MYICLELKLLYCHSEVAYSADCKLELKVGSHCSVIIPDYDQ